MIIHQQFGEAANKVVIEEFLNGIELSVFVITDGKNYKIIGYAKIINALAMAIPV